MNATRTVFLMCPPDYFELTAPDPDDGFANDMIAKSYERFAQDPEVFRQKATTQWVAFEQLVEQKLGAQIVLLKPETQLQDQCFTADASLSYRDATGTDITLISTMTHPLRTKETDLHRHKIKELFPERVLKTNPLPSEGSGDNLYDPYRDLFWSGFVTSPSSHRPAEGRSDKRAHDFLSVETGIDVVSLEVKRPFFHIDTTLAALPQGHLLYYPGGFTQEAFATLIKKGIEDVKLDPDEYLIEVTEEEALLYACNLIYLGNKVVMTTCGDRLPNILTQKGYEVFTTDLSCFIQAGGGPHCLTNNLTSGH